MTDIIRIKNLTTAYNGTKIHDNISFSIKQKEIFAILGGSGSGKSTLLNTMIFLKPPQSGEIIILNKNIWQLDNKQELDIKLNCGVLFQFGALFSSINVLDNVTIMLREYTSLPTKTIEDLAYMWLVRVGLKPEVGKLYPSELSGGMIKRVALARALSLNPKILFLDEPTSGLDPKSARHFDELIIELRDLLGISIVMITHDMDSVKNTVDRLIILKDKKIYFEGSIDDLKDKTDSLDTFLYQV